MKRNGMKRTLLAIAIGAISAGLAGGALAQDAEDENELNGDAAMSEEQPEQVTEDPENALDRDENDLDSQGDDVEDYEDMDADDMDVDTTDDDMADDMDVDETADDMDTEGMDTEGMEADEAPATGADDAFDEAGPAEATLDESLGSMQVSELEGMTVINMEDKEIGDIQEVVKHNDTGDLHAVITVGGFWGMGGTDITLPLAEMLLEDDQLVFQQTYGEDELESTNEYDEERYSEVDDDLTLSEAWGRN
ncbi:PRC-barrel domain-containing protein [Halomonas sp. ANAO-440]|uniref:PRC-barrel domain-containing protein n=1 Tax=Halomonas sp. ANAO-440 TaxID=2861360 RepID=UPI001CAA69CD|nr:PRC-barrel domain-containing protein [Halomonas sp. ANAO-440]MBZ0331173.1 PRC-barrel domain-containing protein [Halomonas sp. ANAO-440]